MQVHITRLREDIPLPTYATEGSIAFDLAPSETVTIPAHGLFAAPTGLIIASPTGYGLFIAPRSSLFKKKGLRLGNTIGVIDQDYCGPEDQLFLLLWNPGDTDVIVEKGERIAQGYFTPIQRAEWQEGPAEKPSRGGIGSTGGYTKS
ncbi:MAG: dUTP diphosphatase [Patescibacteria group bacterium]